MRGQVMNNEETNRHRVSADVDERTRFEMYYPPFAGAIEVSLRTTSALKTSCVCGNVSVYL